MPYILIPRLETPFAQGVGLNRAPLGACTMFEEMLGDTHTGLEEDVCGATFKISNSNLRISGAHAGCSLHEQAVS
jgi:hypothetical protein